MRIAYVTADHGVPVFGRKGCSVHVQELVRAFRHGGAEVELFTARRGGDAPTDLNDVIVHDLPAAPAGELSAREQAALAANCDLRTALEDIGPFDLVYERYSLWSYAGMAYARAAGVPGLLEVNAPLIDEQAAYRGLADRAGAERVARRVFESAAALIAVSREVAEYLERRIGARGKVTVIPNGVNPERFRNDVPPTCPGGPRSFTVGFVGTLKPWHGLSVLVKAFDRLRRWRPSARLLIVGDGPEREPLVTEIASRGLTNNSVLTGAVLPDAVPGLLASMDVAVAPYPARDDFYFSPLKVFEYMAAGRAVVASRVGQLTELIEDGVTGLLCQPGDSDALAESLERLATDEEMRTGLGLAARSAVCRRHSWAAVARRILKLANLTPEPVGV